MQKHRAILNILSNLISLSFLISFLLINFFISLLDDSTALAKPLDYFKNNYAESDLHFSEQFNKIKKYNPKSVVHEFKYSEGLIKSYFFPAKQKQQSLLIIISGTHGIEALAGSAVQRWLLDQIGGKIDLSKTSILMIHGFNLYGFKNFRRANEDNIDLNRNFILSRDQSPPSSKNNKNDDDAQMTQLNSFLNPNSPPDEPNILSRFIFIAKAAFNIARYSLESLRTSILKGQYTYPKGLFYGGDKPAVQSALIADLIRTFIGSHKKIFLIDLHTGYGERAKLHLLAGKSTEENSTSLLKLFQADEIDFADKKKFYAVEGELLAYFIDKIKLNTTAEVAGVTFEYGTLDSQKTLGSIESLRRMVLENQNFHYGHNSGLSESRGLNPDTNKAKEIDKQIKLLYREMFYPSDEEWRISILRQTEEKIKKVFSYLEK